MAAQAGDSHTQKAESNAILADLTSSLRPRDGVYAEQTMVTQRKWDRDGNLSRVNSNDTGLVCLRDTVLP